MAPLIITTSNLRYQKFKALVQGEICLVKIMWI